MAYAPQLDFNGYVVKRKSEHKGGAGSGSTASGHEYTYISDKQAREAFERAKPVEYAMAAAVRVFKEVGQSQILGNGVKVSERQFPRIHNLVRQCSDTLQIAQPNVYIVNNPMLNAGTLGTNEDSFIMIHSGLVDHFTDEELLTVIGHECGHIHNSHVVYLTTLHYLTKAASVLVRLALEPVIIALRSWSRRAEITCDRAGMLCSGDVAHAQHALAKLALGSQKLYSELNLEAFLEQYEEGKVGLGRYTEMLASHPWLPKRVLSMRVFAESAVYRKSVGLGDSGLTMTEVDDRVRALLKGDA
jgi:Zn-dependent protease with chaperone function